jgi:hypothetical protein
LCGRNRRHHAGAFANVAITRALLPSLRWHCCLSRWHQHLRIGIIANISLAPLPSSRSHHAVVFINLVLVVSPLSR